MGYAKKKDLVRTIAQYKDGLVRAMQAASPKTFKQAFVG